MKQNQDYKNESLAALKGNWAPAVLAGIVLYAVMGVVMGPYYGVSIASAISGVTSHAIIPLYVGTLVLIYLVGWPLTVGYYNAQKVLLVNGDNRLIQNMFEIGFGNWLHYVWGTVLMISCSPAVSVSCGSCLIGSPPGLPSGRISRPMTRPGRHKD